VKSEAKSEIPPTGVLWRNKSKILISNVQNNRFVSIREIYLAVVAYFAIVAYGYEVGIDEGGYVFNP